MFSVIYVCLFTGVSLSHDTLGIYSIKQLHSLDPLIGMNGGSWGDRDMVNDFQLKSFYRFQQNVYFFSKKSYATSLIINLQHKKLAANCQMQLTSDIIPELCCVIVSYPSDRAV